ncbi:DUF11 domain-containing protein [bacterium]|nr:DUF11 domain-containing protein [bacterium]
MTDENKNKLIISSKMLSLVLIGIVLPLNFAFAQSYIAEYTADFGGGVCAWDDYHPIHSRTTTINLPYGGKYDLYLNAYCNGPEIQKHEQVKFFVDGEYIGTTHDCGTDCYINENLGERDLSAGVHTLRVDHRWNTHDWPGQANSVRNISATFSLKEIFTPELSISKSVDKSTAQPGEILSYILSYKNSGKAAATGVVISDDYDENYLDIYDNDGGSVSGGKISWNIGTLEAGDSSTKIFKVRIKDGLPVGTTYIYNKAVIDSSETEPLESNIVTTKVDNINHSPTAFAGPDKEVYESHSITLEGSGSDPDGDPISYRWSCTGGYISNRYIAQPSFTAPEVSYDRTYTCTLTVTDDKGLSDSDSMQVLVLNQEEEEVCSKSTSSCSNPDGYMYIGDSRDGCLNNGDWKYYKVRESAGKKIKVELSWSGAGCNVNDLVIYSSGCSKIYSRENNYWTKTWQGTPSSDIVIGLDGDSSNKNCQWSLRVKSLGEGELSVAKSVKNLSRGDSKWYNIYRSANPGDELLFKIVVKSTGDAVVQNVKVKDDLPSKIIYQGNLEIDNVPETKNITKTAINIGDLSPGKSKTIIFRAKVASERKFGYGQTELINTARAYNEETSDTDSCKVRVRRKAVAGIITEVPTGITNRILDSVLFPLGIAFAVVWILKSKFIALDKWTEKRKREIAEYRAKKNLKRKISQLKTQGYFKE